MKASRKSQVRKTNKFMKVEYKQKMMKIWMMVRVQVCKMDLKRTKEQIHKKRKLRQMT